MSERVKAPKLLVGELPSTDSSGSFLVGRSHSSVTTCIALACHLKSGIKAMSGRQLMPVGAEAGLDLVRFQGCLVA